MKRHVHSAGTNTTVLEATRLMKEQQVGFLPVCSAEGRPLGVITTRDLALRVCAENLPSDTTLLGDIMTPNPLCCGQERTVDYAEKLMLARKTRRILIVDERDHLVGLITLADMIQHEDPFKMMHWLREHSARRYRMEK